MATKQTKVVKPTDALHGIIHGSRFTVVLDDVKLEDKWDPSILPVLQKDGLGRTNLEDGATSFIFKDACESTIAFTAEDGLLVVSGFTIRTDGKEEA